MTFHVGQKVVCVDDEPNRWRSQWLTRGKVYTVRALMDWTCPVNGRHGPCILLVEVCKGPDDTPFFAGRFRPVVERKTSIEIFTAMLTPKKAKEPA